jgi:hypothetical protein
MTKKSVFSMGVVGNILLIFLVYIQSGNICYLRSWCNELWGSINLLGEILFVFIPVFLLSLITYKMREEVFRAWWNFARWFAPIIIIVTYFINSAHQQSGFAGVAQGAFETLILIILYAVFIIVSLARIIFTARRIKNNPSN